MVVGIMSSGRLTLFLLATAAIFASPVKAEMVLSVFPTGEAWIHRRTSEAGSSTSNPFAAKPSWIIQCPRPRACIGRSGAMVLTVDTKGNARLHLEPHPSGSVALLVNKRAHELESVLGVPLSEAWIDRLSDPKAILLVEFDEATAQERTIQGFDIAHSHLLEMNSPELSQILRRQTRNGDVTPLHALAETAETVQTASPRLVPHTKPQIEFAIRAQTQPFPAPR